MTNQDPKMTEHFKEFPFEEIRMQSGDYFNSTKELLDLGHSLDNIWSITECEDEFCYGPSHHYINLVGYIATKESHDGNTYYLEKIEMNTETATTGPVKKICKDCKSDNVEVNTAMIWHFDKQSYEQVEDVDREFCCDCGEDTTIIDEPTTVVSSYEKPQFSECQVNTMLCVWEWVDPATDKIKRWQKWREDHGSMEVRNCCIKIGVWVEVIYDRCREINDDLFDGFPFDFEIAPLIASYAFKNGDPIKNDLPNTELIAQKLLAKDLQKLISKRVYPAIH